MSFHRLLAIAQKEFHHVTRDARTLFLVTIAPALLLLILAYVFSFDADNFKLIVLDQDRTSLSREYVADLTSDGTFRVAAYVDRYEEVDEWLQAGRAQAALVIPPGLGAELSAWKSAPVQAVVDGVDVIATAQIMNQLDARTYAFVSRTFFASSSGTIPGAQGALDTRIQVRYNPPLKSLYGIVPGLMAVVLYMPALALSLSLTREKELGSFEGLASTPIRGLEYLMGKTITYVGFGLVSTLPAVLVSAFWFHVPFRGSLWVFLLMTTCYFIASFGLSQMIAGLVKNQQTVMLVMIMVFFVPSFFLAGLILPVDTSSTLSRLAAYSLPVTHFIAISRAVFLKGLGLRELLEPMLALLALGGATLGVSLGLFRKWVE